MCPIHDVPYTHTAHEAPISFCIPEKESRCSSLFPSRIGKHFVSATARQPQPHLALRSPARHVHRNVPRLSLRFAHYFLVDFPKAWGLCGFVPALAQGL
jgi:hypothetical protein